MCVFPIVFYVPIVVKKITRSAPVNYPACTSYLPA
jgi:hypothetical protein